MRQTKRGPGFAAIATLIAVNLLLGGLTVQQVRAGGGGFSDCKGPDNPDGDIICECFGSVCRDDFPGTYTCEQGFHNVNGENLLDPLWEEWAWGPEWTGTTCEDPN